MNESMNVPSSREEEETEMWAGLWGRAGQQTHQWRSTCVTKGPAEQDKEETVEGVTEAHASAKD